VASDAPPRKEQAGTRQQQRHEPARAAARRPAWAKLRIAAGVAAAIGLVAGEILNEFRRRPRLARASRRGQRVA
jgi:hypothetical protein